MSSRPHVDQALIADLRGTLGFAERWAARPKGFAELYAERLKKAEALG